MNKPHKYADVIKAWADGEEIQHRFSPEYAWRDWRQLDAIANFDEPKLEWRVKPKTKKGQYRVALFKYPITLDNPCVEVCQITDMNSTWEKDLYFIKWLTDWIDYEYDE